VAPSHEAESEGSRGMCMGYCAAKK